MSRPREGWDQQPEGWLPRDRQRILFWCIGVLAVVVVLAYGVAFVLETTTPPGPQASFETDLDAGDDGWGIGDETVVVTHEGGSEVDPARLELWVDVDAANDSSVTGVSWPESETWTAGENATYTGTIPANATVVLVWTSPDGDNSQLLAENEPPRLAATSVTMTAAAAPSATTASAATTESRTPSGTRSVSDSLSATARVPAEVVFTEHPSSSVQSHSLTAAASRSWATRFDIVADCPPRCPLYQPAWE